MTPERRALIKAGKIKYRKKGKRRWKWMMDKETYLKKFLRVILRM